MSVDYGTGMPTWPGMELVDGRPATSPIDFSQLEVDASHANLAEAGMALTLFTHQIPEVSRLVWAQEYLAQRLEGHERMEAVVALSRSFLILRLVSGASGIPWVASCLQQPGFLNLLTTVSECESQLERKRVHASILKKVATKLLRMRGRDHAIVTGTRALSALATPAGARLAAAALIYVFDRAVLEVLGPCQDALSEFMVLDLLDAFHVCKVPLAVQGPKVACASGFTRQNAATQFLVWAMSTSRCAVRPFTQREIQSYMNKQGVKEQWAGGAACAEKFEERRQLFSRRAKPWFKPGSICGRRQPPDILPPLFFASMCEYRQAIADPTLGSPGVVRALLKLREHEIQRHFTGELAAELATLGPSSGQPMRKCLLLRALRGIGEAQGTIASRELVESTLAVSDGAKKTRHLATECEPGHSSALGSGQASVLPTGAVSSYPQCHTRKCAVPPKTGNAQLPHGESKCHYRCITLSAGAPGKRDTVECSRCKAHVRRDVMSRHRRTRRCMGGG